MNANIIASSSLIASVLSIFNYYILAAVSIVVSIYWLVPVDSCFFKKTILVLLNWFSLNKLLLASLNFYVFKSGIMHYTDTKIWKEY